MRFLIALILLAFPIAEIWLLIELANAYGWLLLVYLVGIGYLGLQLIRQEKANFNQRVLQNMTAGINPLFVVFGGARNMIAGMLLMLPGVMTDIIAAILLLIPMKSQAHIKSQTSTQAPYQNTFQDKPSAHDDVIEGEFRHED
jgi:UPF0716 protein FxsA